uniref:target of rapamycin complex 2 subunit MAPKAP1 isoform X1 n=1 Tax=Myxine glutinosa TaxID=7769 RepID=UPI00358E9735
MAFLDDPAVLLAHIRQSHVTSDDTGMCEMVFVDHDVEWAGSQLSAQLCDSAAKGPTGSKSALEIALKTGHRAVQEQSTDDGLHAGYAQSMDITSGWDFGIRPRSNTAQRLERLRKERQNQVKCKNVPWKDVSSNMLEEEVTSAFERKDFHGRSVPVGPSLLSLRLEQCPQQLNNPFNEFSKFDGKGHVGTTATKKIDVFLPGGIDTESRQSMTMVVIANARVQDLVGLICWQYTNEGREPKLNEQVDAYCLHIAEDDGEVDEDFPPLDSSETIHKFGFTTLALVESGTAPAPAATQALFVKISNLPAGGCSLVQVDGMDVCMRDVLHKTLLRHRGNGSSTELRYRLEKQAEDDTAVDLNSSLESQGTLEFCLVCDNDAGSQRVEGSDTVMLSTLGAVHSPQHKAYNISCIHRLRFNTEVQLGICGDKVEIEPVLPIKGGGKFWMKQKPLSIDAELLCACEVVEEKSPDHAVFKLAYLNNHDFKHQYFEADSAIVNEIVSKIKALLASQASSAQAEYRASRQRKPHSRHGFSFQKDRRLPGTFSQQPH